MKDIIKQPYNMLFSVFLWVSPLKIDNNKKNLVFFMPTPKLPYLRV